MNPVSPTKNRKDFWTILLVALALLIVGGYLLARELPNLYRSVKTWSWTSVEATVISQVNYSKRLSSEGHRREIRKYYYDLRYTYEVAGKSFVGESHATEYVNGSDRVRRPGDKVEIWVDPDDPSREIYDRKTYTRVFRVVSGLGSSAIGAVLMFLLGTQRTCRDRAADPTCKSR